MTGQVPGRSDHESRHHPPRAIEVRGARVHNLKNLDVDIPLGSFVGVTGLSGSGKSSLAMGVLYAEGSRRYLDALSTYTRRRISQAAKPDVDRVSFLPSAVALRQRPPVPGPRSTVGTMSEALNVLRLVMSRLGSHVCPNGHRLEPSYLSAMSEERDCPVCGVRMTVPGAESFAFNSYGACPVCEGLGEKREINPASLIPDESLTIAGGAVAPWRGLMRSNMPLVAAELGIRTDVPFAELTDEEKHLVLHGETTKRRIVITTDSGRAVTLNATYESAHTSVQMLAGEGGPESASTRADRFFVRILCPSCHGSRLRPEVLQSLLAGQNLAQISALPMTDLLDFAERIVPSVPEDTRPLATRLVAELRQAVEPLLTLGLGYLSLDRAGETLSTGERQRIQLASTLLDRSTGMLFVLDEPSIGLHPANLDGLIDVLDSLVGNGNSLVVVDHDVEILRAADHLLELGPGAGTTGGRLVAQGTVREVQDTAGSVTAPFLSGFVPAAQRVHRLSAANVDERLSSGHSIRLRVDRLFNLKDVEATIPKQAITVVTGMSGAGKTALILDSLVPALDARLEGLPLPPHVAALEDGGIRRVIQVDASPIGKNTRSTPATYSGVFDGLRKLFAQTPLAQERGWGVGRFSYNVAAGRCPVCEGLGEVSLDVQYLPDIALRCTECDGRRYNAETLEVTLDGRSIADVLDLTIADASEVFAGASSIGRTLRSLVEVGLGYLTLGEPTPSLSGGEAQRLRLASELRRGQKDVLFVFDEPSIGLHPHDIHTLLGVFDRLIAAGATIVLIEHDLDMIAASDFVIDLGPRGGDDGGRIVSTGRPESVAEDPGSTTGPWLRRHLSAIG